MPGSAHSAFLARQGMMETEKILDGSTPSVCAYQLLATAPNICCGDLADDSWPTNCGQWLLTKRIQPGQQEVNIGNFSRSRCLRRSTNSLPSSMIVRSAEKLVSNT